MTLATGLTAVFGGLTFLVQAATALLLLMAMRGMVNGQVKRMMTFMLLIVVMFAAFEVSLLLITFYATPEMINIMGPGGLLVLNGAVFFISYWIWNFTRPYKFMSGTTADKKTAVATRVKRRRTRR